MAQRGQRKPSQARPPDIEIDVGARAERLRFDERPGARVQFTGKSLAESATDSERENLPEEVEPDVSYREVRARWRATVWVEEAAEDAAQTSNGDQGQES